MYYSSGPVMIHFFIFMGLIPHFGMGLIPHFGVGTIEITPQNVSQFSCGNNVSFTCKASGTNIITIELDEHEPITFRRNSENNKQQRGPLTTVMTRNDVYPGNSQLTIFEIQGYIENARMSHRVSCMDTNNVVEVHFSLESTLPSWNDCANVDISKSTACDGKLIEVAFHSCPGWEEIQLYTLSVCGSKGCTSHVITKNSYDICNSTSIDYTFNITAVNTCNETGVIAQGSVTLGTASVNSGGTYYSALQWPAVGVLLLNNLLMN